MILGLRSVAIKRRQPIIGVQDHNFKLDITVDKSRNEENTPVYSIHVSPCALSDFLLEMEDGDAAA